MPIPLVTETQLLEQFLETLRALPEVRADLFHQKSSQIEGARRHDAQVNVSIGGRGLTLLVEAKKTIYPRDVREVLWQLKEISRGWSTGHSNDETVSVLVAESISPGAKDALRAEHIGYYDTGGSLFLSAHGIYFYIDKPPPRTLSKSMRSLFSGRRSQVLHALLLQHRAWFGVKELAERAGVSPATTSQVLTELERFDWLTSRGQGPSKERYLSEPAALLDAWVKQLVAIRPPSLRRYFVPAMTSASLLDHVGRVFTAHGVEYAVSHEAAAQRYAPFLSSVSQVRCRLLVGSGADSAIAQLEARVVNEGANLVIIEAKSSGELLFRENVGGVWLASPIQVYLDLLRGEGRAIEMAAHLRKEKIGF